MSAMASQITVVSIFCSCVCSGADERKFQSSASLTFVRGIHWWPVDPPHKGSVTWKMFRFDDIGMTKELSTSQVDPNKNTQIKSGFYIIRGLHFRTEKIPIIASRMIIHTYVQRGGVSLLAIDDSQSLACSLNYAFTALHIWNWNLWKPTE